MNIVQLIMDQLSSSGMGKLSSLLGMSEAKTGTAVSAAVPALLSGLSSMASTGDGAQKLASALGKVDVGSLGSMLSGSADTVADQGSSLLGSLFGGSMLTGILGALAKYTGLGEGVAKKLLGYLTPIIMGVLAKQFMGKAINPQSLTSMFADQKNNIASALPSGLSLSGIPGLSSVGTAARAAYDTANAGYGAAKDAGNSAMKWLVPVLGLAALALIAYFLWSKFSPGIPDVASVTKDLTGNFASLTSTMSGIKDAASAEAALPKIAEWTSKLDGMKAIVDKLPEAARSKVGDLIKSSMGQLTNQFSSALMIPGVSDKLRPALDALISKTAGLGGLNAAQFALPSMDVTKLGGELNSIFGNLTSTLTGVKDAATADAALPKLNDIAGQLNTAKGSLGNMPEAAKSTISSVLKPALAALKALIGKVLAIPLVGDKLKPALDPIATILAGFGN